jgi:hypothetical protein
MDYNFEETTYNFSFIQNANECIVKITIDGITQAKPAVELVNDKKTHKVEVCFG